MTAHSTGRLGQVRQVPQRKSNAFVRLMNSRRIASALLASASLGCIAGVAIAYDSATALRDRGIRIGGEVVEVHTERRDNFVVVQFSDSHGQTLTAEVGNYRWEPPPRVGDRPELIYDPDNPSGNVADARMGPDFFSVWALASAALVSALLVVPTWTGRLDWNKLR